MYFDVTYPRVLPARRPAGFKPPVQRYHLRWRQPVHTVVSDYFAIQAEHLPWAIQADFITRARASFAGPDAPGAHEVMRCRDTNGVTNTIVVAYWLDAVAHARWAAASTIVNWLGQPERLLGPYGYWRECMVVPFDRHETNYSYTDYGIGLARCPGGELAAHDTNAYFGAMRDRIPLSAIDPLESPHGKQLERVETATKGRHVRVLAPLNLAAIRSGQYWARAGEEQHDDYTQNLQPKLERGMTHIDTNKIETGCCSMRMMFNIDEQGKDLDESSVLSYFLSLGHLEGWSHSHRTHLDIYQHAIAMMRKYAEKREVRTWHEVFVLPSGGGVFDYYNCNPETGLLPYWPSAASLSDTGS
jgi:aldoxime dehydratase